MNSVLWALLLFAGVGIGLWLLSFAVEALRPVPKPPDKLRWSPEIPIEHVEVGGNKLRYVRCGAGPNLVLLHTLRTQLDLFMKVIPELSKRFTVYALDYPGHGYSDIPKARYDAGFFTTAVEGFLEKLDLRDVTLAGVSIGGAVPLIIAARHNGRVARVIAINPYDYAKGRGMARSSFVGWLVTYASLIPVMGEMVMRLRNYVIMKAVLRGGVARGRQHPAAAHERNVPRRQSPWPLPRLLEPAAQRRKLGGGNQGLWPHQRAGIARVGRQRLGAALRARARPPSDPRSPDGDSGGRRTLPGPRPAK